MDNLEELLLPPTDAAAYMQNLVFTYGEEVHTEEDSAWGLLDTMFSVVPDKLAGVKRGFIRTENGIEMVQTTPEQERAVQSKREEFGAAFAAALLPWLAGWLAGSRCTLTPATWMFWICGLGTNTE